MPIGIEPGVTQLAQVGGTKTNTLVTANMPAHTHVASATTAGNVAIPDANSYLAQPNKVGATTINAYDNNTAVTKEVQMPRGTVSGNVTNSIEGKPTPVPVNNMQPYIVLNYIICINGIYPQRP